MWQNGVRWFSLLGMGGRVSLPPVGLRCGDRVFGLYCLDCFYPRLDRKHTPNTILECYINCTRCDINSREVPLTMHLIQLRQQL